MNQSEHAKIRICVCGVYQLCVSRYSHAAVLCVVTQRSVALRDDMRTAFEVAEHSFLSLAFLLLLAMVLEMRCNSLPLRSFSGTAHLRAHVH